MKTIKRKNRLGCQIVLGFVLGIVLVQTVEGLQTHLMSNKINHACGQMVRNPDTCNGVKQEAEAKGYAVYVGFDGDWTVK